jgi:hypothetical protein
MMCFNAGQNHLQRTCRHSIKTFFFVFYYLIEIIYSFPPLHLPKKQCLSYYNCFSCNIERWGHRKVFLNLQ